MSMFTLTGGVTSRVAHRLLQAAGALCRLHLLLDCPPQPLAESNQRSPVGQPKRNLASLLVGGGEAVGFGWSFDNRYATHT